MSHCKTCVRPQFNNGQNLFILSCFVHLHLVYSVLLANNKMDSLLIDLRSPDDTLDDENEYIDKKHHIKAGNEGNEEIDFKLSR